MLNPMELALIKKLGGGNGGGGGSGADLLNADGIIKQEVLPAGFPYSEVSRGYVLPETTIEVFPDVGMGAGMEILSLTDGKTYSVNFNGTTYNCVAVYMDQDGIGSFVMGNLGAMEMGEETEDPFFLVANATEEDAGLAGFGFAIMPLDGSSSVVLSIVGDAEKVTQIDRKYIPASEIPLVDVTLRATLAPEAVVNSGMGEVSYNMLRDAFETVGLARVKFAYNHPSDAGEITVVVSASSVTRDGVDSYTFDFYVDTSSSGAYYHYIVTVYSGGDFTFTGKLVDMTNA